MYQFVPALALALAACSASEPGNDRAFVTDEERDLVTVLDGASGKVEATLKTGRRPRG